MTKASERKDWSDRLISAGNNEEKQQNVLISVLNVLTLVMLETALQKRVFATSISQAPSLVQSLKDSEVEQL